MYKGLVYAYTCNSRPRARLISAARGGLIESRIPARPGEVLYIHSFFFPWCCLHRYIGIMRVACVGEWGTVRFVMCSYSVYIHVYMYSDR